MTMFLLLEICPNFDGGSTVSPVGVFSTEAKAKVEAKKHIARTHADEWYSEDEFKMEIIPISSDNLNRNIFDYDLYD